MEKPKRGEKAKRNSTLGTDGKRGRQVQKSNAGGVNFSLPSVYSPHLYLLGYHLPKMSLLVYVAINLRRKSLARKDIFSSLSAMLSEDFVFHIFNNENSV